MEEDGYTRVHNRRRRVDYVHLEKKPLQDAAEVEKAAASAAKQIPRLAPEGVGWLIAGEPVEEGSSIFKAPIDYYDLLGETGCERIQRIIVSESNKYFMGAYVS